MPIKYLVQTQAKLQSKVYSKACLDQNVLRQLIQLYWVNICFVATVIYLDATARSTAGSRDEVEPRTHTFTFITCIN